MTNLVLMLLLAFVIFAWAYSGSADPVVGIEMAYNYIAAHVNGSGSG